MPAVELIQDYKTREVQGVAAEKQGKRIYVSDYLRASLAQYSAS
jgi:hypothetical protein